MKLNSFSNPQDPGRAGISRWFELGLMVVLLAAIALPRMLALGRFVTADEPTWGKRAASFYLALTEKDYSATYQTGHPGVTTMWAGAAAYALRFPKYQNVGQLAIGDTKLFDLFQRHGPNPLELLATARLLIAATVTLTLIASFLFARQIIGLWPALLGFFLIAFEPMDVAHSRLLHTNGLVSAFTLFSLLAFIYYLRKRKLYALLLSGAAAGLGFATVTPGFVVVPAIIVLNLLDLSSYRTAGGHWDLKRFARNVVAPLAIWGATSLLVLFLIWPAMWVDPIGTFTKMVNFTLNATEGGGGGAEFVAAYNSEYDPSAKYFYFYPLTYLWRSTPVVLAGLVLAGIILISRRRKTIDPSVLRNIFDLLVFVAVFTLVMSLGSKKFDRYYLPVYLVFDLIAALGWLLGAEWLAEKINRPGDARLALAAGTLVILAQVVPLVQNYPYYLTYYNPLLGGLKDAPQVMMVGWGEGLNDAALFLQKQPDIGHKKIIAWYPLAFTWYSLGLGMQADPIDIRPEADAATMAEYLSADYAVTYVNEMQRDMPKQLLDYLATKKPIYTVKIHGMDFAWVYKLK
jgi:4-amino-4-deoxy-L-arabinose transferase-like glycosyltransferase